MFGVGIAEVSGEAGADADGPESSDPQADKPSTAIAAMLTTADVYRIFMENTTFRRRVETPCTESVIGHSVRARERMGADEENSNPPAHPSTTAPAANARKRIEVQQ
ncbi:MAG TPA: hypothetical protein VIW24_32210 [Aldersonia sp.]